MFWANRRGFVAVVVLVLACWLGSPSGMVQGELVQYWTFDDGATNPADNVADNDADGNDGVLVSFSLGGGANDIPGDWVTTSLAPELAHSTGALDFDPATNTYVDGGDIGLGADANGGEVTVSLWYKARTLPLGAALGEDGDRLFSFTENVTCCNEATDPAGAVRIDEFGAIQVWPGGTEWRSVTLDAINPGNWHHIALVWRGDQVTGYVDGIEGLTATSRFEYDGDVDPARGFGIAARYQTGGQFFGRTPDGTMDDMAIWNEALSLADILALADGEPPTVVSIDPFNIHWTKETSGLWDVGGNWTPTNVPGDPNRHDVVIDPANPLVVLASTEDRSVRSLTITGANLPAPGPGQQPSVVELRLDGGRQVSTAQSVTIGARGRISGSGVVNGILMIESGGELMAATGDELDVGFAQPNDGSINALGTITFSAPLTNNAGGVINAIGGTLNFNGGLTNNGRLNLIDSTVNGSINGQAAALALVGHNHIVGDLNGQLELDIELRDNLGDHDQLVVDGEATLAGTLNVTLSDEFTPVDGDLFSIVTYGSRAGEFDVANLPTLAGGLDWDLNYGASELVLSVLGGTLACDFNGDVACDQADINALLYTGIPTNDERFDLDNNGVVDLEDRDAWLHDAGTKNIGSEYVPGDTNLDGAVDARDLNDLGLAWQQPVSDWGSGDFNGDGAVNAQDLNDLGINWQHGVGAAAAATIPEPATAVLCGLGVGLALLVIRRENKG